MDFKDHATFLNYNLKTQINIYLINAQGIILDNKKRCRDECLSSSKEEQTNIIQIIYYNSKGINYIRKSQAKCYYSTRLKILLWNDNQINLHGGCCS